MRLSTATTLLLALGSSIVNMLAVCLTTVLSLQSVISFLSFAETYVSVRVVSKTTRIAGKRKWTNRQG